MGDTLDIPGYDHSLIQHLELNEDEESQYEALLSIYQQLVLDDNYDEKLNKLFGYPDSIQNCVAYEAERIKNNREYGDEILNEAVNWKLLLQISPYCEWFNFFDEFGDGTIYFMINQEDIDKGTFENIQVVVQNT